MIDKLQKKLCKFYYCDGLFVITYSYDYSEEE